MDDRKTEVGLKLIRALNHMREEGIYEGKGTPEVERYPKKEKKNIQNVEKNPPEVEKNPPEVEENLQKVKENSSTTGLFPPETVEKYVKGRVKEQESGDELGFEPGE